MGRTETPHKAGTQYDSGQKSSLLTEKVNNISRPHYLCPAVHVKYGKENGNLTGPRSNPLGSIIPTTTLSVTLRYWHLLNPAQTRKVSLFFSGERGLHCCSCCTNNRCKARCYSKYKARDDCLLQNGGAKGTVRPINQDWTKSYHLNFRVLDWLQ